jgi:thioredoxin-like negative regulator of GroEL
MSVVGADAKSYATAVKETRESGRPLVVLVGADWCPGCQRMKSSTMPQAAAEGLLDEVNYEVVNTDQQSTLARKLMRGGSIPQLVIYRETPDGWRVRRFVGAQSLSTIESAVDEALSDSVYRVGRKDDPTQQASHK